MKAAVCLYDGFCNFEFSVLLESLLWPIVRSTT